VGAVGRLRYVATPVRATPAGAVVINREARQSRSESVTGLRRRTARSVTIRA
jgi:hypothetical protein